MAGAEPAADRLGVFKSLSDVPDARRFHQFASAYDGRDTWKAYRETVDLSDRMSGEWARFARRWKAHMAKADRHHALARPADVDAWSTDLVSQFSVDRAYQHWNVIEGFYEWLKWHTEHPHTYNPFHLAVHAGARDTGQIWARKQEKAND